MKSKSRTRLSSQTVVPGLIKLYTEHSKRLEQVDYHPYTVYNPLSYAFDPFQTYLEQCSATRIQNIYFGMNPGPWGMAQTGVPFGDITSVLSWMKIHARVGTPDRLIDKRPILGYELTRSEVSGRRLWGLIAKHYPAPNAFFSENIVLNYCPLLFFDGKARNITPNALTRHIRKQVESICDETLHQVLNLLQPLVCIAIGVYVHDRLVRCLESRACIGDIPTSTLQPNPRLCRIPHPSPANPQANKNWAGQCTAILKTKGIL